MHGAVMLDEQGSVVRPALIWCDVRTEKQCHDLTAKIGQERLIQLTCNPALANFTLTKLLWIRENEPANWKRVRSVMLPKDYVRFRLTGEHATDMADASGTLLLDVANRRWSREMLQGAEIDERLLPLLHESPAVCAKISSKGAAETGLRVGTPVVAGAGDQAAANVQRITVSFSLRRLTRGPRASVDARRVRARRALGPCDVHRLRDGLPHQPLVHAEDGVDPRGRVHTFCHAIPGRWHVMGVTQAAGLSLRWFRDTFATNSSGTQETYDQLTAEAAKIPAGSDGLLWTPYLMGERTPHLDSNARGALVGLTASHTRAHVVRAILEGVAFSLRDTFTLFGEMNVPVTSMRLGGGGARSPLWRQIQADVYGRAVEIVEAEEGAAYGAALLAGVGAGLWPSVDAACAATVRVASRVSPQHAAVATLNSSYAAFRQIYPATKAIFASH